MWSRISKLRYRTSIISPTAFVALLLPTFTVNRPLRPDGFRRRSAEDFHFTPPPTSVVWCECASSGTARIRLRTFDVRRNVPRPARCCPHTGSAVQRRPALAHVNQPLAMRANWHVICITPNLKQAAMWMTATLDIGTVHISSEAIFR